MPADNVLKVQMYRDMVLGRLFELRAEQLTHRGLVAGSIHLGIGEEATQVGACRALAAQDYLVPSHRTHVADIVKGTDPGRLMAEIIGSSHRPLWRQGRLQSLRRRVHPQSWGAGDHRCGLPGRHGRCARTEATQLRVYRAGVLR